jgi:hypothetical protein
LTRCHHFARRLANTLSRARCVPILSFVLVAGLAGCHHKPAVLALPRGVLAPIDLEDIPLPESLPEIAELPPPELGPPSPPPPPKPVPRRRPAPKEEPQPPVQVAAAPEPATLAIGSLSTGGDAAPQSQQEARDLISSILKRIAALPGNTANAQKQQIKQIHNFLDQAQKALTSGDAEGARNLATKARVLMDDLEKK